MVILRDSMKKKAQREPVHTIMQSFSSIMQDSFPISAMLLTRKNATELPAVVFTMCEPGRKTQVVLDSLIMFTPGLDSQRS